MYFVLGMGITNHILKNMVGSVFHHLPSGVEEKKLGVLKIKSNKEYGIELNSLKSLDRK